MKHVRQRPTGGKLAVAILAGILFLVGLMIGARIIEIAEYNNPGSREAISGTF